MKTRGHEGPTLEPRSGSKITARPSTDGPPASTADSTPPPHHEAGTLPIPSTYSPPPIAGADISEPRTAEPESLRNHSPALTDGPAR